MIETSQTTYGYQTVPNDPIDVQMYTLRNGLRLYLSVNRTEPRIFTNIAVRAGSKHDPPETTGLAHYMEHMLFKGSSRIGTLDWQQEQPLLEKIADLYEQYRQTRHNEERQRIYAEIDRLSSEAARLAAPGEYDKLAAAIGAKATNAYTWVEQTVYVNDIPSNELERWFLLESERFHQLALRLFHTELETVYEEFNIIQDNDARKVNNAIRTALFPQHPYGTQTTIGSAEHLRNPSQRNIQWFFNTYYVPNNMAIVLSGDLQPDEAVRLAEKYFGTYHAAELPPFTYAEQPPMLEPTEVTVYGQTAPFVDLAWRLKGSSSDHTYFLTLIAEILHNGQAGLMDIHLNQQQKVLESESWAWLYEDYSVFGLYGKPREGQSLAAVRQLMLQEMERLKRGDFPDWLLEGVIRELRRSETEAFESNKNRVHAITQSFILRMPWQQVVDRFQRFESITKEEIATFARHHLGDNYVAVNKLQGEDPNVIKVEKPQITPVPIQRDVLSEFGQEFIQRPKPALQAVFADFEQEITSTELQNGLRLDYVQNPDNELFRFDVILPIGKEHDLEMSIATLYFPYLGSDRYSAQQVQQELFRLGLKLKAKSQGRRTQISLSGLQESFVDGLRLLDHLLSNLQPDSVALDNVINDILQLRQHAKRNRRVVLREALANYARYGPHSPFTQRLSEARLRELKPATLVDKLRRIPSFEHHLYYFGPAPVTEVADLLNRYYTAPAERESPPLPDTPLPQPIEQDRLFFLDFPIVQTDILLVSRKSPVFHPLEHQMRNWFNDYFGLGLSSVVFQEIRESKALAYSTYAVYTSPSRQDLPHYLQAYVGTQPDKITDALPALLRIVREMPTDRTQIERARQAMLKQMESHRIPPKQLYWEYLLTRERGFTHDLNRDVYERLQQGSAEDFVRFYEQYVRDSVFHIMILGSRDQIDLDYLRRIGPLQELTMEEVFNF